MSNDLKTMPNFTALMGRSTQTELTSGSVYKRGGHVVIRGLRGAAVAKIYEMDGPAAVAEANAAALVLARNNVQALVEILNDLLDSDSGRGVYSAMRFTDSVEQAEALLAAIEEQARAGGGE